MRFVALKAWSNQLQAGSFYLTFWGCQTQGLLSFFFFFGFEPLVIWTENHYLGIPGMLACLPPLCGFEAEALLWLYSILRWQTQIPGWMDYPLDSRLQEEPYSTLRVKQNLVRNFEIGLSCPLCPFCFPRLPLSFSTLPDFRLLEIPPLYPIRLTL